MTKLQERDSRHIVLLTFRYSVIKSDNRHIYRLYRHACIPLSNQTACVSFISTCTYSIMKPDSWHINRSFRHARIPLSNQTAGIIYIVHLDIHVFRYQTRQQAYIVHFDIHVFRYQTRQQAYTSFISTFTYYVIS